MLDSTAEHAPLCAPDARAPPLGSHASCECSSENSESIKFGHGGARIGAGRPPKLPRPPKDVERWYVVRALHNETALADRAMREAGYDVFAPTIFRAAIPPRRDSTGVMRHGQPDRVAYLFVRYIITRLNLSEPSWRDVLECDGVERVISGGHLANGGVGIPIAVPDKAIEWVRQLLGPNGCIDPRVHHDKPIQPGTSLRLLDGPMPDRVGVCEMSDGARVVLLLNLLGRSVRVTVSQSSVEAV